MFIVIIVAMVILATILIYVFQSTSKTSQTSPSTQSQDSIEKTKETADDIKNYNLDRLPTKIEKTIMRTYPELSDNGKPLFKTIATTDPLDAWSVVVIVPYADNGPFFQTLIFKNQDGNYKVAVPMFPTELGNTYKDKWDLPVEIKQVMVSDAEKYHEGVVL